MESQNSDNDTPVYLLLIIILEMKIMFSGQGLFSPLFFFIHRSKHSDSISCTILYIFI